MALALAANMDELHSRSVDESGIWGAAVSSHADVLRWSAADACGLLESLAPACDFDGKKLARLLNVSQRHLQRVFSEKFARTPQGWLNERRLRLAWQMLQTAASVKEVAYSLGFRRASQFSRDFRRLFGVTPSEVSQRARLLYLLDSSQSFAGVMRSERQLGQRLGELIRVRSRNSNPHATQLAGI
jgi:AraC-like DNA-binding protein